MKKLLKKSVDIAIIGAGPGGLGAAIKAREAGAKDVVLIERSEEIGGVLPQCIHNGFGLHYFKEELTGPGYIHNLAKKAEKVGLDVMTHTMVIGLNKEKVLTAATKNSIMEIHAKSIILGMGCRERARGSIRLPGDRPAGVFTAGTAQRLINIEGNLPGRKVVILGSGDIGMIMARRLKLEGAEIVCLLEMMPFIGGLIRNEVQCLRDFNIPVYTSHTITDIIGRERVEGIKFAKIDKDRKPIPGSERKVECDTLLLSVGLIPENELSIMAGVEINPLTGGPLVDENWQTSVPGIFAGGNVVHVHDLADYVTESSEQAALKALQYAEGNVFEGKRKKVIAGHNVRYVVPNGITGNNPVDIYLRVSWPAKNVVISVGEIYKKKFDYVRPSEQIRLSIPGEKLKKLDKDLVVSCEGEEEIFN